MRLFPAIAAVLVTLPTSLAVAKENDRLAGKLVQTDEGASPPGGALGGDGLGGDDLCGDPEGADDGPDVAGGDGGLLRGQAPDDGDVAEADGDALDGALASATNPWDDLQSIQDRESMRGTCAMFCSTLKTAGCAAIVGGAVVAGVATLGAAALPVTLGGSAACLGLSVYTYGNCEALCRSIVR